MKVEPFPPFHDLRRTARGSLGLNTSSDSTGQSLDQAIENGDWEAVATSAAAIVGGGSGRSSRNTSPMAVDSQRSTPRTRSLFADTGVQLDKV